MLVGWIAIADVHESLGMLQIEAFRGLVEHPRNVETPQARRGQHSNDEVEG